ncbi:MAG: hypothetical protein KBA51_04280 [Kiritimatiellae bacterium]|nr:hypothetical protein [Kiritimatiellia bacterium]
MNMKKLMLGLVAAITLGAMGVAQADLVVYNQNNPPDATDLPGGGWGTYRGFGVNLTDVALSLDATGAHTGTTLGDYATVFLTGLTLRHPGSQGAASSAFAGDWSTALVKIYTTQTPTMGTYVGDSTNTQDMSQTGVERNAAYTFNNIALDPTQTYFFYYSNTTGNVDPASVIWTAGRQRVSNNAGHTYASEGLVARATFGDQDPAYDAVFSATVIPEPATLSLALVFGAAAVFHRRRHG